MKWSPDADRLTSLFGDADRRLKQKVDALFASHAAKRCLKSGATIKLAVAALDETTAAAVTEALTGIGAVTEHSGRKRKRLLRELDHRISAHDRDAEQFVRTQIERIGLGSDFRHARPLIDEAAVRHHGLVADFADGWTAPADKPWKDRHPVLWAIAIAIIGAVIGVVGNSLVSGR